MIGDDNGMARRGEEKKKKTNQIVKYQFLSCQSLGMKMLKMLLMMKKKKAKAKAKNKKQKKKTTPKHQ